MRSMPADQPANDGNGESGHESLDGAGEDEAENQVGFGERRGEIAFVQAARLIVNKRDAAADHGHYKDGDGDEPASRYLMYSMYG